MTAIDGIAAVANALWVTRGWKLPACTTGEQLAEAIRAVPEARPVEVEVGPESLASQRARMTFAMSDERQRKPSDVAVHESGHAVAAIVMGLNLNYVTILTNHADCPNPHAEWMKTDDTRHAITVWAGWAAEYVVLGEKEPLNRGFYDWKELCRLLWKLEPDPDQRPTLLRRWRAKAVKLIRTHRAAVLRVAEALDDYETLSGNDVKDLFNEK